MLRLLTSTFFLLTIFMSSLAQADEFTKLLIHSDTTEGSTTFIDRSTSQHQVMAPDSIGPSTIKHSTSEKKFGATSLELKTFPSVLQIADHDDFTFDGDFAIDTWVMWTEFIGSTQYIAGHYAGDGWLLARADSKITFWCGADRTYHEATTSLQLNTWYHVAVTRSGGVMNLFVNGNLENSWTATGTIDGSSDLFIGHYNSLSYDTGRRHVGYIDEFRISNGNARWTSNFPPPEVSYIVQETNNKTPILSQIGNKSVADGSLLEFVITATDPDGDALSFAATNLPPGASFTSGTATFSWVPQPEQVGLHPDIVFTVQDNGSPQAQASETIAISVSDSDVDQYTTLLLHSDTSNNDTTFFDSSPSTHQITAPENAGLNTVQHSTEEAYFGGSSLEFKTFPSVLQVADHEDFTFDGDFTIDTWVMWTGYQRLNYLAGHYDVTTGWLLALSDNILTFWSGVNGQYYYADTPIELNKWYHIAITRSGSTMTLFLNGKTEQSWSGAGTINANADLFIGHYQNSIHDTERRHLGYLDEFRISKGFARWTTDFSPPAAPYTVPPTPTNTQPTLAPIGNKSGQEGILLEFVVTATDTVGDSLTFSDTDRPTGATFDPTSGIFSWTPTYQQAGPHTVTFIVTDSGGLTDSETITISIVDTNRNPVAGDDPVTVDEGDFVSFTVLANDNDDDNDTITVTGFTLPANGTLTDNGSGSFTFTHDGSETTTDSFSYTIGDGNGGSATAQVSINITPGNDPPEITPAIGDQVGQENQLLQFTVAATDPENDSLTFSTSVPLPDGASFDQATATFTWIPNYDQADTYQVTFYVTDNGTPAQTASETITITIDNTNRPPVADPGPPQAFHPVHNATLDGTNSSDPDGDYPLTYAWEITSKPAGSSATLDDATLAMPTFTVDLMGDYIIQLVVTDSLGLPSPISQVLVSTSNTPPIADPGQNQAVVEIGTEVQLDGSQSDDVEDPQLSYEWSWDSLPQGSMADFSDPFATQPSFVADVHGTYVARLTVFDPWGGVGTDTVTISFNNVTPVAHAGQNQSVFVGDQVFLDGSGSSDANFDALTYSWGLVDQPQNSIAALDDPTSVFPSFTADEAGSYILSLVVNDGVLDSPASNITVMAVSIEDVITTKLQETIAAINQLDPSVFKNNNNANSLTNQLNAVLGKVNEYEYEEAYDQLANAILKKTDGCAQQNSPDNTDKITDCSSQAQVYPLIMDALDLLFLLF